MRRLLLMLVALLCACEPEKPTPLAEFRILSISPEQQTAAESKAVTVELDMDPRFLVDYSTQTAQLLDQPTLQVGSQSVPLERYLGNGRFEGTLNPGLEVGTYDVRVSLPDGREATLAQGYRVNQGKPSVSFWIESIGTQIQDRPFTITIHASGTDAELFDGTVAVNLVRYQDSSEPQPIKRSGSFSEAVRREEISIDKPGSNLVILLVDDEGRLTYSNAFRVDPKN